MKYFRITQLPAVCHIPVKRLRAWCRSGYLKPSTYSGAVPLYTEHDVDAAAARVLKDKQKIIEVPATAARRASPTSMTAAITSIFKA